MSRGDDRRTLNAGVNSFGMDPGYGATCDIIDGSEEYLDFAAFCRETEPCQSFIVNELGATAEQCDGVFKDIREYIHES